ESGTQSRSQQPGGAERAAEIPVGERDGTNPEGRIESARTLQSRSVRSDLGGGGEQPRGGAGDGPAVSGAGGENPERPAVAGNAGELTPEARAKKAEDFWSEDEPAKPAVPSRAGLPEELPNPAENPELAERESAAASTTARTPVVTPEDSAESIPVPPGSSPNQMMKKAARIRA